MVKSTNWIKMSKKRNDVIGEYDLNYNGQTVKVKKLKPKDRKAAKHARRAVVSCPNCLSSIRVNDVGVWECTGDRLQTWVAEFSKYNSLSNEKKIEYIKGVSADSQFLELYDRWVYSVTVNNPDEFNCGYTNKMFLPISTVKVRLADPIFVKHLEKKLGRKLTEEELRGEHELWFYNGMYLKKFKKGAKRVRIPHIVLPGEENS